MGKIRHRFFLFNNATRQFTEISDGFICGRTSGDLQFPDDDLVSRLQCRFRIETNIVHIEDMGATNPTRVNTVPLTPRRPRKLYLNDVIEFGRCRMILTNQSARVPANIQDRVEGASSIRAARKKDGVLTSDLSDRSYSRTLVRLSEKSYRMLRIKEFSKLGTWDFSTALTGLFVFALFALVLFWASKQGAFGDLASSSGFALLGRHFAIALAVSLGFTFLHYFLVGCAVGSRWRRVLFVPLWGCFAGMIIVALALFTDVYLELEKNMVRKQCVESFHEQRCLRYATEWFPGFSALSADERRTIRHKTDELFESRSRRSKKP